MDTNLVWIVIVTLFQESPGIDYLIKAYPHYTSISDLPMEDETTSKKVKF